MKKQKIAITGGIGSGKSEVGKIVKRAGFPLFSCDEIYGEVILTSEYIERIKELFPSAFQNGQIDRKRLASIVFSDESALKKLNEASHPLIMKTLYERMEKAEGKYVFAEVPLLFEGGFEKDFDRVLIVMRSKEKRVRAVQERDGLSEAEVLRRMNGQFDYDLNAGMLSRLYFQIFNDGTKEELEKNVLEWLACFCKN